MSAAPILTIQWLRWPEDLHVGHYAENWREIERWANAARCPTATPDWSQVSFRTPHPQWTTWQDAETNYLEFQRFASALAKLGTSSTCPSLFIPYKQWAKPNWPAWDTREEEANLLEIVRWANAMPGCCGCTAPVITGVAAFGDPQIFLDITGTDLTPVTALSFEGTDALSWVENDSTNVIGTWAEDVVTVSGTVTLTTACGSSDYFIAIG
jgi:hypothetical protein